MTQRSISERRRFANRKAGAMAVASFLANHHSEKFPGGWSEIIIIVERALRLDASKRAGMAEPKRKP